MCSWLWGSWGKRNEDLQLDPSGPIHPEALPGDRDARRLRRHRRRQRRAERTKGERRDVSVRASVGVEAKAAIVGCAEGWVGPRVCRGTPRTTFEQSADAQIKHSLRRANSPAKQITSLHEEPFANQVHLRQANVSQAPHQPVVPDEEYGSGGRFILDEELGVESP